MRCGRSSGGVRIRRFTGTRAFGGQNAVAANLLRLFADSEIMAGQDGARCRTATGLRCTPQAMGPSFDTLEHVRMVVNTEVNAAADNPLFLPDEGEYFAAGNFHGQAGRDGDGFSVHARCPRWRTCRSGIRTGCLTRRCRACRTF